MVVLHKITWKEFEKIVQILDDYKHAVDLNNKDMSWLETVLRSFSRVNKQPYNIDVGHLSKDDFRRMAAVIDMWNLVKNAVICENKVPHDDECDVISSKLQRAYFKVYNEHLFPNS